MAIPEQYLGSFKLEKSENYDEYLAAIGVAWMLRKFAVSANPTKIIELNEDGTYNFINKSAIKTLQWLKFKLNEQFDDVGADGKKQKITLEMDGDVLVERHLRVEEGDKEEVVRYTREDDYLVCRVSSGEIHCVRHFKKI